MIKMKRDELTQSLLKEYLTYNPISGIFTANHDSKTNHAFKAGRELGSFMVGYKAIKINKVAFLAHRLAWLFVYGYLPAKPLILDHIDRNRANNAIANLRVVNRSENLRNTGIAKNNTSGFNGVYFYPQNNPNSKWRATIYINGKLKHLGLFKTKEEAIKARKQGEIDHNYYKVKER